MDIHEFTFIISLCGFSINITFLWNASIVIWYIGTNISEEYAASIFRVDDFSFFYPEHGDSRFIRNIDTCLSKYTVTSKKKVILI
jgi:hypothetical protein